MSLCLPRLARFQGMRDTEAAVSYARGDERHWPHIRLPRDSASTLPKSATYSWRSMGGKVFAVPEQAQERMDMADIRA